MRYAIISDVHANLAALEKVLQRIESERCDRVICLGDLVGYGPFPNECIQLVEEAADFVLAGNHDHASIGLLDMEYFNPYAKTAIEWTTTVLTQENKDYIATLGLEKHEGGTHFVHATPCNPAEWNYIMTLHEAEYNFACFEDRVCFIGHSHIPVAFLLNGSARTTMARETAINFDEKSRYIINVGSVGQPRDGNINAAFGIFDSELNNFRLVRVDYDIRATQRAMMALNLPKFLIDRIQYGR